MKTIKYTLVPGCTHDYVLYTPKGTVEEEGRKVFEASEEYKKDCKVMKRKVDFVLISSAITTTRFTRFYINYKKYE